jgi:hypothetical protein
MRIGGSSRVGPTSSTKRSGGASKAASGSFKVDSSETASVEVATVSGASALTAVDGILALQEVDDPTTGTKKAVKRANDMLDILEDMRLGLISGGVPLSKLNQLVKMVEARRDGFSDPQLTNLIDEIELRARVEIAKWQKAQ